MSNMFEIGFWLDLTQRIRGLIANAFRWVFATRNRLLATLGVLILGIVGWGFIKLENTRQQVKAQAFSSPSPTPTTPTCQKPKAITPAEKTAATMIQLICTSPSYPGPRKAATSRALSITETGASPRPPETALVERFAFNLPNRVEQIGGPKDGVATVLASSSTSQFLLRFNAQGQLVAARDITQIPDATPTETGGEKKGE